MQDKKTLITIIVLIIIFIPLTILGTYNHFKNPLGKTEIVDDNPNKDFIYKGKAYFYLDGKLLGTYVCESCQEATPIIDDEQYHTNSHREGATKLNNTFNSNIALFAENDKINIYSIPSQKILISFNAIKTYNVEHTSNVLMAKKENYWGVLSLETFSPIIDYSYDYIAIPSNFVNGKLDTSKYIAKKEQNWYIIDTTDSSKTLEFTTEIVDFNDSYYVTYDNGYHIYDYKNNEYMATLDKTAIFLVNDYVLIVVGNNLLVYQDLNSSIVKNITLPDHDTVSVGEAENNININIDKKLYQNIELP